MQWDEGLLELLQKLSHEASIAHKHKHTLQEVSMQVEVKISGEIE